MSACPLDPGPIEATQKNRPPWGERKKEKTGEGKVSVNQNPEL